MCGWIRPLRVELCTHARKSILLCTDRGPLILTLRAKINHCRHTSIKWVCVPVCTSTRDVCCIIYALEYQGSFLPACNYVSGHTFCTWRLCSLALDSVLMALELFQSLKFVYPAYAVRQSAQWSMLEPPWSLCLCRAVVIELKSS